MSTDEDRRQEARMEEIDDQLDRRGVTCEDCGHRWIPGRGCCPLCGGAISDNNDEVDCPACGGNGEITVNFASSQPRDPQLDHEVPCDLCRGTGVVLPIAVQRYEQERLS